MEKKGGGSKTELRKERGKGRSDVVELNERGEETRSSGANEVKPRRGDKRP